MLRTALSAPSTSHFPNGPFTSADAHAAGISRWTLAELVARGEVRRVLRNVYVMADAPDTISLRANAAALVVPRHSVAVDETAAWLWGVDAFRPWALDVVPRLQFFVPPGHKRVNRGEVGGGERDLSATDITVIANVTATTPLRTSLDLACSLPRYEALAAMDALAQMQGVTVPQLHALLPRYRRRRGVVQARGLVPLVDPRSESAGESFVRCAILDAGLPRPELQHEVTHRGAVLFRLDLAYPRLRICVEYDGEAFHSSDEQRTADRIRRAWLRDRGWIVIVVDKDSFRGEALDRWLHELRDRIAERTRHQAARQPSPRAARPGLRGGSSRHEGRLGPA